MWIANFIDDIYPDVNVPCKNIASMAISVCFSAFNAMHKYVTWPPPSTQNVYWTMTALLLLLVFWSRDHLVPIDFTRFVILMVVLTSVNSTASCREGYLTHVRLYVTWSFNLLEVYHWWIEKENVGTMFSEKQVKTKQKWGNKTNFGYEHFSLLLLFLTKSQMRKVDMYMTAMNKSE